MQANNPELARLIQLEVEQLTMEINALKRRNPSRGELIRLNRMGKRLARVRVYSGVLRSGNAHLFSVDESGDLVYQPFEGDE